MKTDVNSPLSRRIVLSGALAGLVGGLLSGAALALLGLLPEIAAWVGAASPLVGFGFHMLMAALFGAGFGLLVWQQRP